MGAIQQHGMHTPTKPPRRKQREVSRCAAVDISPLRRTLSRAARGTVRDIGLPQPTDSFVLLFTVDRTGWVKFAALDYSQTQKPGPFLNTVGASLIRAVRKHHFPKQTTPCSGQVYISFPLGHGSFRIPTD